MKPIRLYEAEGGDVLIDQYCGEWFILDRGAVTKFADGKWRAYSPDALEEADENFGPFTPGGRWDQDRTLHMYTRE